MLPKSPVIPGQNFDEIIIAKDQPEYMPLPVIALGDAGGSILSRWEMNEAERKAVSVTGELYINLLTFGREMPVVKFQVDTPVAVSATGDIATADNPKTVYVGSDLPVLQSNEQGIWLLLRLTDEDRQTLAANGDVYFFMETKGQAITPSLLQVEKPDIEEIVVEFYIGVRASEKSEQKAVELNIEIFRDKCSICSHEVIVSMAVVDTISRTGAKIICSICAEDCSDNLCVLPETMAELKTIVENSKND